MGSKYRELCGIKICSSRPYRGTGYGICTSKHQAYSSVTRFFQNQFLGDDSLNYAKDPIDEYQSSNTYKSYAERAGKQPGDPIKLTAALVELADMKKPPVHLILGPDSFKMIMDKRERDLKEFESFKEISLSTNLQ